MVKLEVGNDLSSEEGKHNVENFALCSLITRAVRSGKVSYTKKSCVRWP